MVCSGLATNFVRIFILLKFSSYCQSFLNPEPSDRSKWNWGLADAVASLLSDELPKETFTLNILAEEAATEYDVKDFIDEILFRSSREWNSVFRIEFAGQIKNIARRKKRCSIITIKTLKNFLHIYRLMTPTIFKYNGIYVIIMLDGKLPELIEIFRLLWKIQIYNVFAIYADNNSIVVESFDPFRPGKCNEIATVVVNTFSNGSFEKKFQLLNRNMNNLHGCPIRVSISTTTEPFVSVVKLKNGSFSYGGEDIRLLNTLAETLNFAAEIKYQSSEGYILDNGTAVGPLKALLDGKVDLSISNWWLKTNRLKFFDSTTSYLSEPLIIVAPPGRYATSIERLVYAFKFECWTLIFLCLAIGFIVISMVTTRSHKKQAFVFGSGIRSPSLNMFAGFVGGTQTKLPKRNFARFLLIAYLLYSLVVRTVYQASLFQFLQSNHKYGKIKAVQEVIELDFKLYVSEYIVDLYQGSPAIKSR